MIDVVLRGKAFLTISDPDLMEVVKETLSLENPQYKNAVRFSKYPVTRIPKTLLYYDMISPKEIAVPRGFLATLDLNNIPYRVTSDERVESTVDYPPFLLHLRKTQEEAFLKYIENTDKGLIILPTGKGKTVLGINIASRLKQKVLVIVHKDDLVRAWTQDYHKIFGENAPKVGLIKAKKREVGELMTITTIQTLSRMSAEELSKYKNEFGMCISDEVHKAGANSYKVINELPACYRIGFTATLERNDDLEYVFSLLFGDVAYRFVAEGVDEDILPVQVNIRTMKTTYTPVDKFGIPYDKIPYENRPIASKMLIEGSVLTLPEVVIQICDDIKSSYNRNESIVVFFTQKAHIDLYYDRLKDIGVDLIQKYYGDSEEPKDTLLDNAESRKVLVTLATYGIATEGTNVKSWETAFLVSSVNNGLQTEQAIGRIRRTAPHKKSIAQVYDYSFPHVYSIKRHIYTRMNRYNKLGFTVKNYV